MSRNVLVAFIIVLFSLQSKALVVLQNTFFSYGISDDGKNLHFLDKIKKTDYLYTDTASYCASIMLNGTLRNVNSVVLNKDVLTLDFGENVIVKINVRIYPDYLILSVADVTGEPESLNFLNIPLKLEAMPYEPFATCALSMNLYTHVRRLPALQPHLWATCYKRFGIKGAATAILGVPQKEILTTIRKVISKAKDIPFSDKGGAWAKDAKEGYGSYLMNFGTLTETTVDEWIETCKSLGFNQIDSHGGGGFFDFGTLELNKEKWPDGWDSFKRINARLHQHGISHIFHTYAFFIDKTTNYVTPVPHKDLGYVETFTLAEPLTASSTEITVNESTAHVSTITGFHTENSITLRLDDELIEFSEVTKSAPFKFRGLKRGANGTSVSSHKAGITAYHLSERFGRFVPDPDSELFQTIARKHAEIVNHCDFDGIYLDAIDGAAVLGGEQNFWYYGTKFIFEIAKRLKKSVGMEMSSMAHHWWHYRSRYQAWDRAVRGYKRFIDIHLASVKNPSLFLPKNIQSNEWEHGLWRGNTPQINKYAAAKESQTMLPLHLGWWGNQTWDPPQIEPTFPDDVEYLATKMLANNAGYSQLGGVDKKTLDDKPLFKRAAGIIRQYEMLRHQKYFDKNVLEMLQQPGKEFTLIRGSEGEWTFKPRTYTKHKAQGKAYESRQWISHNDFEAQPLKLRIEPLMSVKPYNDPSAIVLTDFSDSRAFIIENASDGVSAKIVSSDEMTTDNEKTGAFVAINSAGTPSEAAFINAEKKYEQLLSLKNNKGLGVWIKGDGNGQLLNLSLRSPVNISHGAHGDRFIKIDFVGWKYFELVEIESSKISDYIWPNDSHFYVYDSYRHTIEFDKIESLQLWYNNLPKGKEVRTIIGPVKALPLVEATVTNPSVRIGDKTVVFPVTMKPGMYLEFFSENDCKLYGAKGELISDIKIKGNIPILNAGDNEIEFNCESNENVSPRVQVTVIGEGLPLKNTRNKQKNQK
ncbi:MAG: hypothetical protein KF746_10880 [Chitinophagaceae bacterium]|nr:hypothetical protein [Chitinophagaceae bacterium]